MTSWAHQLALECASRGMVSGRLEEWPVLAAALKAAGRELAPTAGTIEMRSAARAALGEDMGRGNCCEHCEQVGELRSHVAAASATLAAVAISLQRIEKQMVTRGEFTPVRAVAFGLVGLVMTGFVLALFQGVMK